MPVASALSHEHACKTEVQFETLVAELLPQPETAGQMNVPDGRSIPEQLVRREVRLAKLVVAHAKIEARAEIEVRTRERCAQELAAHQAKLATREAKKAPQAKSPAAAVNPSRTRASQPGSLSRQLPL